MDKLPKGWISSTLGEVSQILGGGTPSKQDVSYYGGKIPWASVRDMNVELLDKTEFRITEEGLNQSSSNIVPKGSLVIATRVGLGKVCILANDTAINQDLKGIIPNSKINTMFLFYWFKNMAKTIEYAGIGATVKGVKLDFIKSLQIPLPPLPMQTRIVSKLDSLFSRIDKSITLLEENLKQTQALIDSSISGIFDQLSNRYESSPLLKYVDFIGGSQPPKSKFSNEAKNGFVRLIQIRDYKSDNYVVYIDEKSTNKFCKEDDVMIGRYGPPVFQILRGLNGAYNVALMKAVPNEEKITKDYLYYFLQNSKIQNYIISISQRSAGQSGVNKKALEMYEIAIPPLSVQKVVVNKIRALTNALNKLIGEQQSKLTYLKALKSSILDRAFKGELS